ncbi:hypothetical protein GGS21DRAFT_498192 [Xylaria nigripes]|nr:hypothetical protein GGS21DRAFT_498192 [Xylaria nigripes]
MADRDALRDAQVPDPDEIEQEEEEDDDDDPPPPESLAKYLDKWRYWYNLVVHRGEDVLPRRVPPYTENYVTNEIRPAPFPLGMSETWYCGALLALITTVHSDIDKGWLTRSGSPHLQWAVRVVARVLLTVGAAILSTFSFEIAGSLMSKMFHKMTMYVEDWLSRLLIIELGWGDVDEDGEPMRDEDGNYVWFQELAHRVEPVRNTLQGLIVLAFDYFFVFLFDSGNQLTQLLVEWVLGPSLYFFLSIPPEFVPKVLSWLVLPTPGLDGIQGARTLWFEYGVPIVIQFQVLLLFWLLKILYMAKSERLGLQGWRVNDPKMALVWHLIRATAMHLLAYTAYQLVCGVITALKPALPQVRWYHAVIDGPVSPFLGRIMPEGRIFAAALLFFFHWLFRAASVIGVRLARPLWMPYILWQTRYSKYGADVYWPLFVEALENDLTVLNPSKRVISRVLMTAVFGLRSSWPARFPLSSIVDDN